MLNRLYERLDLNGPNGRPANGKVIFTLGVFALWALVWFLAIKLDELNAAFLGLVVLAAAASGGPDLLKAVLKSRFGGLADALREQERQRPATITAEAEALAVRRRASSDTHPGTEAAP